MRVHGDTCGGRSLIMTIPKTKIGPPPRGRKIDIVVCNCGLQRGQYFFAWQNWRGLGGCLSHQPLTSNHCPPHWTGRSWAFLGAPGRSWALLGSLGLSFWCDFCTTFFPDSSGEEAFPKEVWMLIFVHFVRKPFQRSLGAPKEVDFCTPFFQILVVRKLFQRELGGAKRRRFLHNFFPDSRGEEAIPKGV